MAAVGLAAAARACVALHAAAFNAVSSRTRLRIS
jgi:hypothetical protein